ncbi:uncharacterized protein [Palaemon carinicauda]|uniref:uncharacterized protein n=1 Tax=Palaemon carinicauda TaxID=392227 RepID=UPI0035B5A4FD
MEDIFNKNSGDNDYYDTQGDGLVAGGHKKVDKTEVDGIEEKYEGDEDNLQEGEELELDEIEKREHDNDYVGENYENTGDAESTSQSPVEKFTLTPEGTEEANTAYVNYSNNHDLNDDEEADVEEDDEIFIVFENNEEDQHGESVSSYDSSGKRNRRKNNRKNKRKRNKNKNKRVGDFVLENGHQDTFQEAIEDFNITLIELNLKRLNTSSSRESRHNMLYMGEVHMEDPVNPPQLESVSLWQYFLNMVSGKESEAPPKSVIIEKHLDNPCDFLLGDYGNW